MSQRSFDLDAALAELRADAPSPEARLRARRALIPSPRKPGRLAAVAGGLVLLFLPAALRTRGSEARALTFAQALRTSQAAPYAVQTIETIDAKGRRIEEELIWAPNRRVERMFFRNGAPGLENRHLPGLIFERRIPSASLRWHRADGWRPFETISKSKEPVGGTEGGAFELGERAMRSALDPLPPVRTDGRYAWFRPDPNQLWKVELASNRIVRMEIRGKDSVSVSRIDYPSRIDPTRLDVPPRGPLPRFDLDLERAEMDRLNAVGDRTMVFRGRRIKLVGVFQEVCAPGWPIYVAYEGAGLARARGLSGGGLTTLKSIPPKAVATVFATMGPLRTLDVEVPVGDLGYASFKEVRVRPVSEGIRSALRTPAYE